MPKVGNKTFPYTDKGEGQAEVYAAQTGQPISREEKDGFGYGSYQEGGEYSSPKARLDQYLQPYLDEYLSAGEDEGKAYWLALIDIGMDSNTKHLISEDPELQKMYKGLFESNDITYLDVTHHRQTRRRLGLESPHMDAAEEKEEGMQRGGPVKDQFGYGSYQEGGFFTDRPDMFANMFSDRPDMFSDTTKSAFPKMISDADFEKHKTKSTKKDKAWVQSKRDELKDKVGFQRGGPVKRYGY